MIKRVMAFFFGIALGIGLAVLIGWTLFPMDREEIAPASMRADYQAEYIRLIAVTYQADGDLVQADSRLRVLNPDPITPLVTLTEQWIVDRRSKDLVMPLIDLANALGVTTPAMNDYQTRGNQ